MALDVELDLGRAPLAWDQQLEGAILGRLVGEQEEDQRPFD